MAPSKVIVRGNGNEINPQRTKKFTRASINRIAKAGQPSGWQGKTKGPG